MEEINFKKKAIAIFQDWAKNAIKFHANINLQIKEYSVFEIDLIASISSAKKSLTKEEKYEDRKIIGYDYGYMCGFIQSNINVHWNHEYITKQSNEFKTFAAIKSLESYLEFDAVIAARLNSLYKNFYKDGINVEDANSDINTYVNKKIDFLAADLIPKKNDFKTAVENVILHYISVIYQKNDERFLFDVEKYFTKDEINTFLESDDF